MGHWEPSRPGSMGGLHCPAPGPWASHLIGLCRHEDPHPHCDGGVSESMTTSAKCPARAWGMEGSPRVPASPPSAARGPLPSSPSAPSDARRPPPPPTPATLLPLRRPSFHSLVLGLLHLSLRPSPASVPPLLFSLLLRTLPAPRPVPPTAPLQPPPLTIPPPSRDASMATRWLLSGSGGCRGVFARGGVCGVAGVHSPACALGVRVCLGCECVFLRLA